MRNKPIRIALLGAESTGKTSLSLAMSQALSAHGQKVLTVTEKLREWCNQHGRTPQAHEQAHIAASQCEAIFSITEGWVIADTTALMTAVYSDYIFQDKSLYDFALDHQSQFDATLLMGLDVAWVADGLQRDGQHVREPVDNLLRQALSQANIDFKVVYGQGHSALDPIEVEATTLAEAIISGDSESVRLLAIHALALKQVAKGEGTTLELAATADTASITVARLDEMKASIAKLTGADPSSIVITVTTAPLYRERAYNETLPPVIIKVYLPRAKAGTLVDSVVHAHEACQSGHEQLCLLLAQLFIQPVEDAERVTLQLDACRMGRH
jgi:nicotinamide riboside kinase